MASIEPRAGNETDVTPTGSSTRQRVEHLFDAVTRHVQCSVAHDAEAQARVAATGSGSVSASLLQYLARQRKQNNPGLMNSVTISVEVPCSSSMYYSAQ